MKDWGSERSLSSRLIFLAKNCERLSISLWLSWKIFGGTKYLIILSKHLTDVKNKETDRSQEQNTLQLSLQPPLDVCFCFDTRVDTQMRENVLVKDEAVIKGETVDV